MRTGTLQDYFGWARLSAIPWPIKADENATPAPDPAPQIAELYGRFARGEAQDRSPLYAELALGVAGDRQLLELLASLPPAKRQPNLLLASVRFQCGLADGFAQFRQWILEQPDEILATMRARRTQTNEPARCATLLPLLATLPQPLALLEVGAAAGLCLLPDRYSYDYGGHRVPPSQTSGKVAPQFACQVSASTPLPRQNIEVSWRAGLELEPIDVHDLGQTEWLEALVWPGEGERLELLRAALDVAQSAPPRLVRGDLRSDLPALAAQAPPEATLVVFHTAVLAYVDDRADRAAFADTVGDLDAVWVANEAPGVLGSEQGSPRSPLRSDPFLLSCDGRPIAWTDSHGGRIDWIG